MCPDRASRETKRALEILQKLVEQSPDYSQNWSWLAAAHYRAANYRAAKEALEKARQLRYQKRHDGLSQFLLAMTHWRLGDKGEARRSYGEAVKWTQERAANEPELHELAVEARGLLGINEQPARRD
jgi:tetratricopeptide (TPR) repeat protein